MTSGDILELIKAKHSEDLVVPECRTGESNRATAGGYVIMDCWTAPHSWVHFDTTAYEIKVARSDFAKDTKWYKYLPYCHYFYFAAIPGIVNQNELPPEVGLYEASTNCRRLLLRKKAVRRKVDIPEEFYKYLLICRTIIRSDRSYENSKRKLWEAWLADKTVDKLFGRMVSKTLRRTIEERITKVQEENQHLKRQNNAFEDVRTTLKQLGVDTSHTWSINGNVHDRVQELRAGLPKQLDEHITQLQRLLKEVREGLCKTENTAEQP